MKYCQKCQLERSEEYVFCQDCGSRLVASCILPELADNSPREVLRFFVQKYPECVKDYSLLKWLLSDSLANARAECFLLYAVAENGIPELMQKSDQLSAPLLGSLSEILTIQCFIQPETAREGILIWAYALDLKVDETILRPAGNVLTLHLPKGISMELVWCPPGNFMMGSPEGELGRWDEREAQHRVTLTMGFWIGKYAVTQEQYEAVTGNNPSKYKGARRPVERVNWDEAMDFCSKIQLPTDGSIPSGYILTLPTEAQWEYACRAGTTSALNNRLELTSEAGACANLAQVGWYSKNSNSETHEVGQKSPNTWGLYDMHGNVWEWCLDWYDSYDGAATNPTGPSTGSDRVIRGGSWYRNAKLSRSAYRGHDEPNNSNRSLGFRSVLTLVQ